MFFGTKLSKIIYITWIENIKWIRPKTIISFGIIKKITLPASTLGIEFQFKCVAPSIIIDVAH